MEIVPHNAPERIERVSDTPFGTEFNRGGSVTETKPEPQSKAGSPFAIAARGYLKREWDPLPVPYGSKQLAVSGWTGYKGERPSLGQVKRWINERGGDNIAIRMPEDVIGIDVDAYGEKFGDLTLDVIEMTLGPLPATWRSTSRHDSDISGIYWFRLPEEAAGLHWHDLGGDVETISWHHRYAVVWPSIHPETGQTYGWYDSWGKRVLDPPSKDDLATLPVAWIQRLLKPAHEDRSAATRDTSGHRDPAHGVRSDAQAWIENSLQTLDTLPNPWHEGAFWDQTTFNVACDLVRLANSGWTGYTLEQAEEDLHVHAPTDEEWTRDEVDAKWRSALVAVGDEARPDPLLEDFGLVPDEERADLATTEERIFTSSPILGHIRMAAHSAGRSAMGLLCATLARVLTEVGPGWVLPGAQDGVIGRRASLNLGFAFTGISGGGKTDLVELSQTLLGVDQTSIQKSPSSGEGLIQSFLEWDSNTRSNVLVPDPRRIFNVDEIGALGAVSDRNGATIGANVRTMLTGGHAGTENATAERNRNLAAASYRMVLMVGVQPRLSGTLLDDEDAGLPQRFVWVRVVDDNIPHPDERPEWPGEMTWELPIPTAEFGGVVNYPDWLKHKIKMDDWEKSKSGDQRTSHRNLACLKVAVALAFLHGERDITDRWWQIAEMITSMSDGVQRWCRESLANEFVERAQARGRAEAHAQIAQQEVTTDVNLKRASKAIMRRLDRDGGETAWSDLYKAVASPIRRDFAEDALDALVVAGLITVIEHERNGVTMRRVRIKN